MVGGSFGFQPIRVEHEHAGLKRNVAGFGGPQPGRVRESDSFEGRFATGRSSVTFHAHERFQRGRDDSACVMSSPGLGQ